MEQFIEEGKLDKETGEGIGRNLLSKKRNTIYIYSFIKYDKLEELKEYIECFFTGIKVKLIDLNLKIRYGKIIDEAQSIEFPIKTLKKRMEVF